MKKEVFDLIVEFHNLTISGAAPSSSIIMGSRDYLVNNNKTLSHLSAMDRKYSKSLAEKLDAHFKRLSKWERKYAYKLYTEKNKKKPSPIAFNGALSVVYDKIDISVAATMAKVNYQCVKSLVPRITRYADYSEKLKKLI